MREDTCPNPNCSAPNDKVECPSCGLPLVNTEVFYPSKWKNALLFPVFTAIPVLMTVFMMQSGTMTTAKWAITAPFYAGWLWYVWMFATNRLLEVYIVSRQGLHIVPYRKSAKVRHILWEDVASISKMINSSSKQTSSLELKLRSGQTYSVSPMLHDANAVFEAIEMYAPLS